ncbi:MAG TPA: hypothetical protein VGH70_01910 [Bradyrhizobium sp.]|jgi:hypothetical protein
MTKHRFAKRLACAYVIVASLAVSPGFAQQTDSTQQESVPKTAKPINTGDVLSGELTAMRVRGGAKGKRVATYQITSEPRRLPPPNGLCNLETGPETFQLITTSEAQATELRRLVGKEISIKVDEISCAQDAGQMTEAVVTRWSVVKR